LPFRDDVFEKIYSNHVIEHVPDPVKFLREVIRVAKAKIEINCPHRFGHQSDEHINFFTRKWLIKVFRALQKI